VKDETECEIIAEQDQALKKNTDITNRTLEQRLNKDNNLTTHTTYNINIHFTDNRILHSEIR